MPPKSVLTREQIVERAFEILRTEGYDALNARYLASSLGVSTMPLFKHYENMEEIKKAAVGLGVERYSSYMQMGMGDSIPFKGVGRAYIRFAKEEPKLFEIFFMRATNSIVGIDEVDPNYNDVLDIASKIMNGNNNNGEFILRNMWLIVHGIATLEVTGKMSFSDDEISEILSTTFLSLKTQMERRNSNE